MGDFEFVKGSESSRNKITMRAKFRALQLVGEGKQAKEALAQVASEFDLDGAKSSWTKFAGSTINRFRSEIRAQLAKENAEVVSLMEEFGIELGTEATETTSSEEEV